MSATVDRPAAAPADGGGSARPCARGGPRAARRGQRLGLQGRRGAGAPRRRADGPARAADVRAAGGDRRRARPRGARRRAVGAARAPARAPSRSRARREARRAGAAGRLGGERAAAAATRCSRCAGRCWSPTRRSPDRITAPFTALFRPWVAAPGAGRLRRRLLVRPDPQGRRVGDRAGVRQPGAAAARVRARRSRSAAFHEIGHAAACRYGGGRPGGMGAGIYMVWPAFYTDVTDAYRLPRRARLRTDLGGIYFNAVIAVVTLARLARCARRRAAAADRASSCWRWSRTSRR